MSCALGEGSGLALAGIASQFAPQLAGIATHFYFRIADLRCKVQVEKTIYDAAYEHMSWGWTNARFREAKTAPQFVRKRNQHDQISRKTHLSFQLIDPPPPTFDQ